MTNHENPTSARTNQGDFWGIDPDAGQGLTDPTMRGTETPDDIWGTKADDLDVPPADFNGISSETTDQFESTSRGVITPKIGSAADTLMRLVSK